MNSIPNPHRLRVRAWQSFSRRSVAFLASTPLLIASGLAWRDPKPGDDASEPLPTFTLELEDAQRLIDDLWAAGLRPTEGSGSAGSLAATERHLADLRTLAFHALKIPSGGVIKCPRCGHDHAASFNCKPI